MFLGPSLVSGVRILIHPCPSAIILAAAVLTGAFRTSSAVVAQHPYWCAIKSNMRNEDSDVMDGSPLVKANEV